MRWGILNQCGYETLFLYMKGILVKMFVFYLESSVLSCVTEMEKEPKISLLQIEITYY